MSTSNVNMINLIAIARDQIEIDEAIFVDPQSGLPVAFDSGTTLYDYNIDINSKHYNWQSEYQTVLLGLNGEPERFAQNLREALPQVNNLRLPFNEFSFNPDGSLPDEYERFIVEAVAQGFEITFSYHGGNAQNIGSSSGTWGHVALSNVDAYQALQDNFAALQQAWTSMLDWVTARPHVEAGTYGYDVMNEAAGYRNSIRANGSGDGLELADFVKLYADHSIAISDLIKANGGDTVLVGMWGYNGDVATFDKTQIDGQSAIEYIQNGVGDGLTWSAHLYPGWSGTGSSETAAQLAQHLDELYAPVLADGLIITETNAHGRVNDYVGGSDLVDVFTQTYEWFAENGVGIGWFTGAQSGGSSLVTLRADGSTGIYNQHSYAHAMNAFSLGETDLALVGNDTLSVTLVSSLLRNQKYEETQNGEARFDVEVLLGSAYGYEGNDSLNGTDTSNDFLYGGFGDDTVTGGKGDDFLFGQQGNDLLQATSGINHFWGGEGDDTLIGGDEYDQYSGATGADTFVIGSDGHDVILDFTVAEDRLDISGQFVDLAALQAAATAIDKDVDGQADDLTIALGASNSATLLNTTLADLAAMEVLNYAVPTAFDARATVANGTALTDISQIRDFDGNDLGAGGGWKFIGQADVQFDGDAEFIYINPTVGRWATVGPDENGNVDFSTHGEGGETRVVGIYIDPEVTADPTKAFGPFDSQQRFQNDLATDNLTVIDAFDFDGDGFQEIYFRVNDGSAYLRALMHADGNIQYANYQSAEQVADYLTGLGNDQRVLDEILA